MIDYVKVLSGMNENSREALLSRAERIVLNRELDRLTEEIVATRQALQLENADKQFLADRAKELGDRLKHIKNRQRELEHTTGEILLEKMIKSTKRMHNNRPKLPGVFSSLKDSSPLKTNGFGKMDPSELDVELAKETDCMKGCIESLKDAAQKLAKQEVQLRAKYDIGDISRSRFLTAHSEIRRNLAILKISEEILDQLACQAEDVLE
ncbi:MAG: hypothetical protein R6V83_03225 [Candidatus Thorarchaeota archaeon]